MLSSSSKPTRTRARAVELSWLERSRIIFFHLHPDMGGKDTKLTSKVFSINPHTLGSWVSNKRVIPRWHGIVEAMEASQVVESIPKPYRKRFANVDPSSKVDLHRYDKFRLVDDPLGTRMAPLSTRDPSSFHHANLADPADIEHASVLIDSSIDLLKIKPLTLSNVGASAFSGVDPRSLNARMATGKKRVSLTSNSLGRNRSHREQEEFILQTIHRSWESGDPITKTGLRNALVANTPPNTPFYNACCNPNSKGYPGYLNKFISRALERGIFTQRKKVIVERIATDWRQRVETHANQIAVRMRLAQVEALVASDEIFVRFHDGETSLNPSKHSMRMDSTSASSSEPQPLGCILIASIELLSAQFLPPVIVFTGGPSFSKQEKLIWKQIAAEGGPKVIESPHNHIDAATTITLLEHIKDLLPDKKVGVLLDSSPSHLAPEVSQWIAQSNASEENEHSQLLMEYVDYTLSCIYHPLHVAFESSLKQAILNKISDYKKGLDSSHQHAVDSAASLSSALLAPHQHPGPNPPTTSASLVVYERCPMSREKLAQIFEEACADLTAASKSSQAIPRSFKVCGVDPWQGDAASLEANLDNLSVNMIYDRYLSGQQYIELF